jgi:hypothetical protein
MLTKAKNKAKYPSSILKPSATSGGSSRLLEIELIPAKESDPEMAPSHATPEIQAAQRILAHIAVRILTARKTKTDEY